MVRLIDVALLVVLVLILLLLLEVVILVFGWWLVGRLLWDPVVGLSGGIMVLIGVIVRRRRGWAVGRHG